MSKKKRKKTEQAMTSVGKTSDGIFILPLFDIRVHLTLFFYAFDTAIMDKLHEDTFNVCANYRRMRLFKHN